MAAAAFVTLAVGAAPSAADATSERIVFESDRDANWELYAMNGDGSSPTRLTFDPRGDVDPATSASGARIAFARGRVDPGSPGDPPPVPDREDDWVDIYVMDADGSNVRRLTRDAAPDRFPSFSPDGSKIAFMSYQAGYWDVHVVNADGSGRVSLTERSGLNGYPAWSPDGSKIAFARSNPAASAPDIYLMNADGSAPARLTTAGDPDFAPAWSPDGRRIVFHRYRFSGPFAFDIEIFVINTDGSGERQLTDISPPRPRSFGAVNWHPSWSPDGTRIAFARHDSYADADADPEIYVMNADGSGPRALTRNTANDLDPAFAPRAPDSRSLTG